MLSVVEGPHDIYNASHPLGFLPIYDKIELPSGESIFRLRYRWEKFGASYYSGRRSSSLKALTRIKPFTSEDEC